MTAKITLVSVHLAGPRPVVSFGRPGFVPRAYTRVTRSSMRRLAHIVNYGDWRIRVNTTGWHAHRKESTE